MLKIMKYLKAKEWLLVAINIGLIVVQVYFELRLPDYMNEITLAIQSPNVLMKEIWQSGGMMMLCAFASLACAIIVGYIASTIASSLSARLRENLYSKVESFSMEEINKFSTASLITRSTNDITQVQQTITMGMQVLVRAPVMAIWAIFKIANKSWQWSVSTAVAVFAMVALLTTIIAFTLPKFKRIQAQTDDLNKATRENLTGIRVIRAYNAEDYQQVKFEKTNSELTKTNLFTHRMMGIMQPGLTLVMNGLSLAVYWLGAYIIEGAEIAQKAGLLADMITYSAYAMQVVMSFLMLVILFIMIPRASVSANRINEVMDTKPSIIDGTHSEETKTKGEIEFKNVYFKYPDASDYILKDINFTAKKGEVVAFIGATGSGKSTLINLIPRFYDVSEGEVVVDGINVKEYKQSELNNKIGYISQRATIFSGTIASNVDFGSNGKENITNQEILNALDIAQASEYVNKYDDNINHPVAQNGTNLSGGQKQRLSIARAVARKPEIYIFDDSFSALDYKTDKVLRKRLFANLKDATVLIVAQRIGTIRDADKIIVLENGEIVGMGKHEELLENCSVYNEIALSQLSKEEL